AVTFSAGGRGMDQNGDGVIGPGEGAAAASPNTIIGERDAYRQTVADWMQLVREIQVGMDVDGDGTRDLDPSRISYFGLSRGGILGPLLLAVEPDVRAGVFLNPGAGGDVQRGALSAGGTFRPAGRPATGA